MRTNAERLAGAAYLALLLLQPAWHALLPEPTDNRNWVLAAVATLPLLVPLRGVLTGSMRSMTWAGYLVMVYIAVGIMEAWSNPPQRIPALLQTALVVVFVGGLLVVSRSRRPER